MCFLAFAINNHGNCYVDFTRNTTELFLPSEDYSYCSLHCPPPVSRYPGERKAPRWKLPSAILAFVFTVTDHLGAVEHPDACDDTRHLFPSASVPAAKWVLCGVY